MKKNVGSLTVTGMLGLFVQFQPQQQSEDYEKLVAHIGLTSGGLAKSIELYGDYVVRQIGLDKNLSVAKRLTEVAMGYLSGDKSQSDHSLDDILLFLSRVRPNLSDDDMLSLNKELVKELDACMISYFAFHWHHAAHLLDQVRNGARTLRNVVIAATRQHRFQKIMKTLKAQRAFATLLETLKAMSKRDTKLPNDEVAVPAKMSQRSPVLLVIGGGMGAGKSTVVKEILGGSFWSEIVRDAVIVEADAFKETDVVYRALTSSSSSSDLGGGDFAMASQLVHDSSTRAASSLLVSALNDGRDVVFDGTMSWEPFVMQTIAMARDVHLRRYRLGPGYRKEDDGTIIEKYWEPLSEDDVAHYKEQEKDRRPYRIELVGVTCDALLAVVRGIRRAIITNRVVPIKGQLNSHKMFAASIEKYCEVVDCARIYSTSKMGGPPELIGYKDGRNKLLVDGEIFSAVKQLSTLNPDAGSILELFGNNSSYDNIKNMVWREYVMSPERTARQEFLKRNFSCSEELLERNHSLPTNYSSSLSSPSPSPSPSPSSVSSSPSSSSSTPIHHSSSAPIILREDDDESNGGSSSNSSSLSSLSLSDEKLQLAYSSSDSLISSSSSNSINSINSSSSDNSNSSSSSSSSSSCRDHSIEQASFCCVGDFGRCGSVVLRRFRSKFN